MEWIVRSSNQDRRKGFESFALGAVPPSEGMPNPCLADVQGFQIQDHACEHCTSGQGIGVLILKGFVSRSR